MFQVACKVINLILVATSITGWLIFVAGFCIFVKILAPKEAPLPSVIGVSWTAVLSPMITFGLSSLPLYLLLIVRIFVRANGRRERITTSIIMGFDFFYWLGLGTTIFALALLLVGGLGDYLKNIFNLSQKHIMVMAIGCLLSVVPYYIHLIVWPLSQLQPKSNYRYKELVQSSNYK